MSEEQEKFYLVGYTGDSKFHELGGVVPRSAQPFIYLGAMLIAIGFFGGMYASEYKYLLVLGLIIIGYALTHKMKRPFTPFRELLLNIRGASYVSRLGKVYEKLYKGKRVDVYKTRYGEDFLIRRTLLEDVVGIGDVKIVVCPGERKGKKYSVVKEACVEMDSPLIIGGKYSVSADMLIDVIKQGVWVVMLVKEEEGKRRTLDAFVLRVY